jgi:exonuclease III
LEKKSLDRFVETVDINNDRLVAIKLVFPQISIMMLQVYLPSVNHGINVFKETVDKMVDFCAVHSNTCNMVIMGDFNARFDGYLRSRDIYALNFASRHSLIPITINDICSGTNYTFIPYNDSNPSKIDHFLVDEQPLNAVKDCRVIHNARLNISRHLPLFVCLDLT